MYKLLIKNVVLLLEFTYQILIYLFDWVHFRHSVLFLKIEYFIHLILFYRPIKWLFTIKLFIATIKLQPDVASRLTDLYTLQFVIFYMYAK
jgi:hypothetical protein